MWVTINAQDPSRRVRIGKGFAGMRVGVYPTEVDGIVRLQFYATIMEVDLNGIAQS